jgi:hypothetical protein
VQNQQGAKCPLKWNSSFCCSDELTSHQFLHNYLNISYKIITEEAWWIFYICTGSYLMQNLAKCLRKTVNSRGRKYWNFSTKRKSSDWVIQISVLFNNAKSARGEMSIEVELFIFHIPMNLHLISFRIVDSKLSLYNLVKIKDLRLANKWKISKERKVSILSGTYISSNLACYVCIYLWGISSPPSTAPFNAPKTLAPVVVRARPTSRKHRNGRFWPSTASFSNWPPVISVVPLYISSSLCFCNVRRAKSKPVQ